MLIIVLDYLKYNLWVIRQQSLPKCPHNNWPDESIYSPSLLIAFFRYLPKISSKRNIREAQTRDVTNAAAAFRFRCIFVGMFSKMASPKQRCTYNIIVPSYLDLKNCRSRESSPRTLSIFLRAV